MAAARLLQDPRASTRRRRRTRSRRPTASSRASTTRTATRTTGGRGALQGDLRGLRRPRRPGEAQEVRPRRRCSPAATRSAAAARAARRRPTSARSRTSSPNLFDAGGGGARHAHEAGAPSAGATSRPTVSISFDQAVEGAQIPVAVPTHAACGTCRGTGAKPGHRPKVCPRCQGRGVESQGQGLFSITRPWGRARHGRAAGHRRGHRAGAGEAKAPTSRVTWLDNETAAEAVARAYATRAAARC